MKSKKRSVREWQEFYDTPFLHKQELYSGKLGAYCSPEGTEIRLWSPAAEAVVVRFFESGGSWESAENAEGSKIREGDKDRVGSRQIAQELRADAGDRQSSGEQEVGGRTHFEAPMRPGQYGVWYWHSDLDLHGVYYDFVLTIEGKQVRTADPYAKACGVNGRRSMLVDLRRTDPEGWEEEKAHGSATADERREEPIIYELHVKDFSWDPAAGFPESARGKYSAFLYTGTTLNGDGIHPTGIDYLKKLGVNCIELMPVYDFGSVDEAGDDAQYNWGYDPLNYNVPEGSYSTDPYHGEVRIRELKEAILSLHRQGFRVIMDVVYNHTYSHDSWLQRTAPWYYYRADEDGVPSNGSGCGNDIASERPMCARYILDSVLYWAQEYHMDGFRFDLMGLLDVELMNRIRRELDRAFGRGKILLYGEPWAAGETAMRAGSVQALKANIGLLDPEIAMFCDDTRDCIKGSVFDGQGCGFVNGARGQEENVMRSVTAWCCEAGEENPPEEKSTTRIHAPSQVISYVSCHDNLTLWDKLCITTKDPELRMRQYRLAAMIYLTCQGTAFMLSGEEFARTKGGNGNSYNASAQLNQMDWTRASENRDLVKYYRGLIALRKELSALCDKSAEAWKRIQTICAENQVVCFLAENTRGDSPCISGSVGLSSGGDTGRGIWRRILVAYNASDKDVRIHLPDTDTAWQELADTQDSFLWRRERRAVTGEEITVPAVSGVILGEHMRR